MKMMSNNQDAFCTICGTNGAVLDYEGRVLCPECKSSLLKTAWGKEFIPQFHSNMFRRNNYTSAIICRRRRQVVITRERRTYASISA